MSSVRTPQLISTYSCRLISILLYNDTTIMAAITAINPFPNEVWSAFDTFIHGPTYSNREQILYEQWQQMHFFINNPTLKAKGLIEANLKHCALTKY
jgi:hypothetical protein